ncbi:MAG TPA: 2-C-methyl-D-erythritol 2,4-cyclodiphosphate synthase [Thermodesulfovibrionia bacterium]|nr:2-C-methyl-D-erythritol 2,4-cyclodiphosphate synthase [Thermodesulfovibrionia bacterium]
MRVGTGYDSHRLVVDRKLILGGAEIPFDRGLMGHSDADVLTHAIIDALIGALGLGDIGRHFPDTDDRWKDASSVGMLAHVLTLMQEKGFDLVWLDTTLVIEKPKIAPHIPAMKSALSKAGINSDLINIKAKTNEGMGFVGKGEGVEAHAVCLLRLINK